MVTNYAEFVTCRCAIGFSLASFVSTQYWTTQMFTPKIVGGANAITAGWGNLGGGITQVVTVRPPPLEVSFFAARAAALRGTHAQATYETWPLTHAPP